MNSNMNLNTNDTTIQNTNANTRINDSLTPNSILNENEETSEQKSTRVKFFQILALPTLIYAVLYTFFLYDNFSSITMPLFVLSTIYYIFYCMKKLGVERKKESYLYSIVMLLLSISSATTGNDVIITFNFIGIILLLLCMLLHNYYDDHKWTMGKYLTAIFTAVCGAISCIPDPFSDAACYHKQNKDVKQRKLLYVLIGICIAIPVLFVIVGLLYSADAVFASILDNGFQFDFSGLTVFGVICMFVFALFSAYCGIRFLNKKTISAECKDHRHLEPIIAITVLSLVSIVYLFFSMIQFLYLFWGKMQLPSNYTYATYAREGFFQLLFVCILNVVIVLFVISYFKEQTFLKILLGVISVCTYIILASSAFRMILYIQNYHLTFLRVSVLWALVLIAILLIGILIQVFRKEFPLFRYGLVVVCIGYLALAYSHPDYIIAKYNLAHMYDEDSKINDYSYIRSLSSDAAPAIAGKTGDWVSSYAYQLASETSTSIRKFNIADAYARSLFDEQLPVSDQLFYIEVMNYSDTSLTDVGITYAQNGRTIGSGGECNADGTSITYVSYDSFEEDNSFFASNSEYVYRHTFEAQDFTDKEDLGTVSFSLRFTDQNEKVQTCASIPLNPEFGNTYTFYLYGDGENGYYLTN